MKMLEGGRENVLTRVLLHVIGTSRPVDSPRNALASGERGFDDVHDLAVVVVGDLDDSNVVEAARIERLAAGCRIEGRPVETDAPPRAFLIDPDDMCVEDTQ